MAEIARVDIAGVDNDGTYFMGGHCKSGQKWKKVQRWTMQE